jgi:hypothetical protein
MSILSVTDTIKRPSLIPYLQSGPGRFHLLISLEPASELSPFEPCQDPFQFRDVSDPFTLLGNARIVGDLGEQLLPLHMLIQRSDYLSSPEESDLNTNLSIDQRWQQIKSTLATSPLNNLHVLLAEQIGKQGQLLQFRSLFYCRAKQSFFHPACPGCGKELELCIDDVLLSLHGLEGYSTSLRRFLYCPQCCSDIATGDYYVFKRTEKDPDCVRDIQQLIRNWASLDPAVAPDTPLPCPSCPGYKACYGSNTLAANTLCSFSFYPFYMLLLKAESEMSLDFQALLSGKEQPRGLPVGNDSQIKQVNIVKLTNTEIAEPVPETDISKKSAFADATIRAILEDIATQWESVEEERKQPPLNRKAGQSPGKPDVQQRKHTDLMETVILNSASMSQDRTQPMDRYRKSVGQKNENFAPNRTSLPASQFHPTDTLQLRQTMSEDQKSQKDSFDLPIKNRPETQLLETIIIPPQPGQQIRNHLKASPLAKDGVLKTTKDRKTQDSDKKKIDVDPAETLIQRPGKKLE